MKQLREEIETLLNRSKCSKEEISLITQEKELYPFSCESRILVYLMSLGKITYDEYVLLPRFDHTYEVPYRTVQDTDFYRNSLKPQKKISLMYILLLMANLISG